MKTFLDELQSYHEAAMNAIRFLTDLERWIQEATSARKLVILGE